MHQPIPAQRLDEQRVVHRRRAHVAQARDLLQLPARLPAHAVEAGAQQGAMGFQKGHDAARAGQRVDRVVLVTGQQLHGGAQVAQRVAQGGRTLDDLGLQVVVRELHQVEPARQHRRLVLQLLAHFGVGGGARAPHRSELADEQGRQRPAQEVGARPVGPVPVVDLPPHQRHRQHPRHRPQRPVAQRHQPHPKPGPGKVGAAEQGVVGPRLMPQGQRHPGNGQRLDRQRRRRALAQQPATQLAAPAAVRAQQPLHPVHHQHTGRAPGPGPQHPPAQAQGARSRRRFGLPGRHRRVRPPQRGLDRQRIVCGCGALGRRGRGRGSRRVGASAHPRPAGRRQPASSSSSNCCATAASDSRAQPVRPPLAA